MILRLSSPAARILLALLASLLATALSYSGIRNALAVQDAELHTPEGYQRAIRLEPDDATNWSLLGRYWPYNLEDPHAPRVIRAYQTALSFDSPAAGAWLDLATAYESEGDIAAGRNAFLQAKRAYSLSPEVSWRYGNFLLRRGELDAAFAEIKHAVEADPKRGRAAVALSRRLERDLNAVLERVLPHTQGCYFSVISALAEQQQTDQALMVWSGLAALHPHMPISESYPLLAVLLQKRRMTEAQRVWDEALAFAGIMRPSDPRGALVWDGGFESNIAKGGLTWYYPTFLGGVPLTLDTRERHSANRSLRLTFHGLRNVNFNDVCQYVAVQPSTSYRFSAWVGTRDISTDEGVRFGLQSLSDSLNSTAWTDDVRGTQPWTEVELPWTSGNDVRELHLCVSRLPSAKFPNKIGGSAWIADVSLVPQSAENTKQ
jgi:tetratricopeptide (TPR) repeat protein